MSKFLTLLLWLLTVTVCQAQFTDSTNYYAAFTSSGSINKTNDGDAYLLNNAVKFSIRKKRISLNTANSWIYGKQDKDLTNNDFSSSLDFNVYHKGRRLFYWGLANYNTSYSLKINNQLLAGAGVAYNLVDKKNTLLNISDGILYDKSDLYLNDTTRDVYHTFRNSFRLLLHVSIKGKIIFDGSGFLQNSLLDRPDYIIRTSSSLSVKLNKWLSFVTSFNYNTVRRTKRENMLLSYGLTLEKYF